MWRLWAKALGEKHGRDNTEADKIALIRTIIVLTYIITNLFIVAGVIRHWNDNEQKPATASKVGHGDNVSYSSPNLEQQRQLEQIRLSVICSWTRARCNHLL